MDPLTIISNKYPFDQCMQVGDEVNPKLIPSAIFCLINPKDETVAFYSEEKSM